MRLFALLILSAAFCSSCTDEYSAFTHQDPVYELRTPDAELLGEGVDGYTRRGETLTNPGNFQPEPNESYDSYRDRLLNTLVQQEERIAAIEAEVVSSGDSRDILHSQLTAMESQENEMRIALASFQGDGSLVAKKAKRHLPFERYTIQPGDTLQKIAFNRYGTHTAWLALYRFNHKQLPYGPNQIEKGDVLILPHLEALSIE